MTRISDDANEFFKTNLFSDQVSATFSKCQKYRYVLSMIWDVTLPRVMFIGLNPSTANHEEPDNTIVKVKKITKANGFGGFYMLNLFAMISSKPEDLLTCDDPLKNNDRYLEHYGKLADKVCFCWGTFKESKKRNRLMIETFQQPICLAITKDGSPKHPLYCRDNTVMIPYHGKTAD